ncbi:MAG: hypothetical protein FWG56_03010 [Desulfovibrionaceae bacterium]|jgi:hypothetical protein|nr:hypothetical protein [Desulfovibrionaceae bacterium]
MKHSEIQQGQAQPAPFFAVESWLRNQVGPAHDALKANPSRAVTAAQVRECLAAEYAKAR